MSMTMPGIAGRSGYLDLPNVELGRTALRIADSRSLTALRDALFIHADALIGPVAMGLYIFDRTEQLRYVSSRLAPQGFLDEYEREYRRRDTMLDCIVSQRRTIDGFHFHGPSRWRRSDNYEILRGWGFHHNMGGALVVNGRTAGALFVATAHEVDPFEDLHVKRLDLMCRAASLALTAMRERERLRCELYDAGSDECDDPLVIDYGSPSQTAKAEANRPMDLLPARSREVAKLLCRGRPNKAIAQELGISVHTVKEHVHNLCRRFGALNRTDLVHRLLISPS
jgi:DNA-binding CsgD family transcriptional regulator